MKAICMEMHYFLSSYNILEMGLKHYACISNIFVAAINSIAEIRQKKKNLGYDWYIYGTIFMEFGIIGAKIIESLVTDTRFMSYIPSVFATAIMIHVINDLKPREQEKVNECYELLLEHNPSKKRMMNWLDQDSPSGVSTLMTAQMVPGMSLLLQYHPHEQQMRLPSKNHM
ncbi:hypothetical protein YC2023_001454 [Brassica napus]